jgi:hypothetical protein
MLVPFTKVVMTYRPKGSLSFVSWPEAGPKRRHHSIQYPVRARTRAGTARAGGP